jgi:hypothetical protein
LNIEHKDFPRTAYIFIDVTRYQGKECSDIDDVEHRYDLLTTTLLYHKRLVSVQGVALLGDKAGM